MEAHKKISFSYQSRLYRIRNSTYVRRWIIAALKSEKKKLKQLRIVFCSDKFLLDINKKFLKHDYFTDIVTFHYHKKNNPIEGELFISVERVKNNAKKFDTSFSEELHRVIIHGVLHLCGYTDKNARQKIRIHKQENRHLSKRRF